MSFVVNNTTIKDKIQIVETESTKETKEFKCQNCKGAVQILAKAEVTLKDMPDYPETVKLIKCHIHRYFNNRARSFTTTKRTVSE